MGVAEFPFIFSRIRAGFAVHAERCVVLHDEADRYFLGSHEVRAKDGYRTLFGGVEIGKTYVSAHLMPLYIHPDMRDAMSPNLRRRMQGKSCFNFTRVDDGLFDELDHLVAAGLRRFEQDGRL